MNALLRSTLERTISSPACKSVVESRHVSTLLQTINQWLDQPTQQHLTTDDSSGLVSAIPSSAAFLQGLAWYLGSQSMSVTHVVIVT